MFSIIEKMFELSTGVIAFNSLSSWAKDPQAKEFYADPATVLHFCRELTPWVVLRHEYHPRDFTVFMYKQKPE